MIGKLANDDQRNWCELVPYVTYAYNAMSHGTTSFLPFYLMYMRRARTPIELLYDLSLEMQYENEDAYCQRLASECAWLSRWSGNTCRLILNGQKDAMMSV